MTPERWEQVDKLLEQALERTPGSRAAFLEEACNGDDSLRREVESLLAAHEQDDGRFSSPAVKVTGEKQTQSPENLIGQSLSHYQILARLGEGGMGVVYKARDTHLNRFVAIKVLPASLVTDPDRKRRFVQEARAASALNHPNIVTIHDIANVNGTDFIVMECVQGKTLDQLIPRRGMKLNDVLEHAIQIADALAKAHTAGIIHRDLKPGNIMVSEGGLVKVLDFGLAKLVERSQLGQDESGDTTVQPQTEEGMILGTASYMSPEQAAGKPVDARSDIFTFGSVLYEMVTGQRAFQGDSKMSTLAAILNQEPKAAREIAGSVPYDLEKIITRCLRKDPSRRFQSMQDLKVALEELKEEFDSRPQRAGVAPGLQKAGRTAIWGTIGVVGIALALAALLGWGRLAIRQQETQLIPVPLTSYPGWERSPSFSPDGSQVAFEWSKTLNESDSAIYVKQIGVEQPFPLTDSPAADVSPAWSPDGASIAFGRYLPGGRIAYFVKPQRGGPERNVAEFYLARDLYNVFAAAACAWTPDSQFLVVVGRESPEDRSALFLVSLATLQRQRLTDPPAGLTDGDPAVSPEGKALTFSRSAGSVVMTDLYRLALSSDLKPQKPPERITVENRCTQSAVWTPDGHEILFISGNTVFDFSLWRIALSNPGPPRRLAFAGQRVFKGVDVSRRNNRLVYTVSHWDTDIWRIELRDRYMQSKVEGVKLIESSQMDESPAYSPDGKRIAFRSYRSGSPEIWLCNSDGSNPQQLTSFGGPVTNAPRWSPDGQQLVFHSNARGNLDIYVMPANGGVPKALTTNGAVDKDPSWSADGGWVYFSSDRNGQMEAWKVPAQGGEAIRVQQIKCASVIESPDGKFMYYAKGDGLWRVPTAGGDESFVVDSLHPLGGQVVVEDDGVYYISKPDKKGVAYIRLKDFNKGEVRTVAPIGGQVYYGFTVSPDRRSFLYTKTDNSGSDLMLVENFR